MTILGTCSDATITTQSACSAAGATWSSSAAIMPGGSALDADFTVIGTSNYDHDGVVADSLLGASRVL